jgi:competence protein ComEA
MPEFDAPPRPAASERPGPEPESSLARATVLDRVHDWRSDRRVGMAVAVLVVLAAAAAWMRTNSEGSSPERAPATATSGVSDAPDANGASRADGAVTTTSASGLLLHVVGAVRAAGVVELAPGARVRDAVAAAGGAADDADLERMNLAAPVADGQRIAVPRIGEPLPAPAAGDGAPVDAADPEAASGPLNINAATAAELEQLPGIGPTLAEAIVREREKRGRFDSVEDLKQVRGIGEGRFADIRDLVTV